MDTRVGTDKPVHYEMLAVIFGPYLHQRCTVHEIYLRQYLSLV